MTKKEKREKIVRELFEVDYTFKMLYCDVLENDELSDDSKEKLKKRMIYIQSNLMRNIERLENNI